jgi:hypothetical protein
MIRGYAHSRCLLFRVQDQDMVIPCPCPVQYGLCSYAGDPKYKYSTSTWPGNMGQIVCCESVLCCAVLCCAALLGLTVVSPSTRSGHLLWKSWMRFHQGMDGGYNGE